MSPRLALEVSPWVLRGVVASAWRDAAIRTVEVAWSPAEPEAGLAALRQLVGPVESIAVAIGVGLLHVARVALPPAPDEARVRMLTLESARYFATESPVLAALAPGGSVAIAVDAALLERWCAILEEWAPITRIEGAPSSLARALAYRRGGASGDYRIEANEGEHGFLSLRDGKVDAVRRIPVAMGDAPGASIAADGAIPASHRGAWGVLLAEDAPDGGTLASPARRRRFAARRRRRLAVAVLAAAAGIALAFFSIDRWRDRTLRALEADVAARRESARAGAEALATTARLDAEVAYIGKAAHALGDGRGGALGALAAISHALPGDAVIRSAHAVGREWQVDGTASSAAALVPHLDTDGHFEDVRILSASSRFRDGPRTRETFSIALRVRPGA